jgi:hypothetical protein
MEDLDPELQAMATISKTLSALGDDQSRTRVLKWAAEKFASVENQGHHASSIELKQASQFSASTEFSNFVDILEQINPTSDLERMLAGAYWLQVLQNNSSWQSFNINSLLKNTGQGINSINHVLDRAKESKPAYVLQITKSGKSKQARKTYKLTTAGINYIKARLAA